MRYQALALEDPTIVTLDASQPLAEVRDALRAQLDAWLDTQERQT